jgi:hypothetical protein
LLLTQAKLPLHWLSSQQFPVTQLLPQGRWPGPEQLPLHTMPAGMHWLLHFWLPEPHS